MNIHAAPIDQRQRSGQLTLNSSEIILNLPSMKIGAVVLNEEFVIHCGVALPQRKWFSPQKGTRGKNDLLSLSAFCAFLWLCLLLMIRLLSQSPAVSCGCLVSRLVRRVCRHHMQKDRQTSLSTIQAI